MSAPCQAYGHRYVGRGAERTLYEGPCVLERGHDEDHLPSSLASVQMYDAAFNAGVDAAMAAMEKVVADLRESDRITIGKDLVLEVRKTRR